MVMHMKLKPSDLGELLAILLLIVVMSPLWLLAWLVGGRQ